MKAACSPASSSCSRHSDDIQDPNALDNNPPNLAVVHDTDHCRRFPCSSHEHLGIHYDRGLKRPAGSRMRRSSCFGTKLVLVNGENPWCQCGMDQRMDGSGQGWVANRKILLGVCGARATTHCHLGGADRPSYATSPSWGDDSS